MKETENHCDICKKTILGSSYKFKSHLYSHKSPSLAIQARYKCTYCLKEYFRKDMFNLHIRKHAGIPRDPKYICDHCDRSFVEKRNLAIHLKVHDDHKFYKYKCMACGISYCEERMLKYHIRKTHFNLHEKESIHIKKELNDTWVEKVQASKVCVQMTKVNNNVIVIKKLTSIKDEIDNKGDMKNSVVIKDETNKIPEDNKTLKKTEQNEAKTKFREYITSVFAHTDKSQYSKAKCDYCNKEMLKKSLLSHIRERHLKLRRFTCEQCKCTFKRHYQMVGHICGKFKPKHRK